MFCLTTLHLHSHLTTFTLYSCRFLWNCISCPVVRISMFSCSFPLNHLYSQWRVITRCIWIQILEIRYSIVPAIYPNLRLSFLFMMDNMNRSKLKLKLPSLNFVSIYIYDIDMSYINHINGMLCAFRVYMTLLSYSYRI